MSSKSVSPILKNLFQTGDINAFVLRSVFFSRYVQIKSSFSDEKNSGEIGRSWSSARLFIVQNYIENANGDVPLIVEYVWYF